MTIDVAELAETLNTLNPFLDDDERHLARTTYRLLAEGEPVAPQRLAREAGLDIGWTMRTLDGWTGVFTDDEGRIVGFWGMALEEMDHRFEFDGRTLYTWCAWDPIFAAPLLGVTARVTSTCPVTEQTITLVVGPEGVSEVGPPQAVLSFLRPTSEMREDVINSFCHYVRLFASEDAANTWIAEHAGTFVLGLDDAFELGRRTLGRLAGARNAP